MSICYLIMFLLWLAHFSFFCFFPCVKLQLTDVVPGRYVFRLKVMDEQGSSSEDTVSVIVKPGKMTSSVKQKVLFKKCFCLF